MKRTLYALLGLALFGALFASIYYTPDLEEVENVRPTFGIGYGDVRPDFIEPSVAGGIITVDINIIGGPIDVYIMDQEWLASTIEPGESRFNLSRPFNYHSQWTVLNATGHHNWTFVATGEGRLAMVFDNSDSYYNDTVPAPDAEDVHIAVTTRYLAQESKSLVYGYLAAIPSVALVALTIIKQVRKRRRLRVP